MYIKKAKRIEGTYEFYYRKSELGKYFIIGTQKCKQPKRTKLFKQLEEIRNNSSIHSYGYMLNDEERKSVFGKVLDDKIYV